MDIENEKNRREGHRHSMRYNEIDCIGAGNSIYDPSKYEPCNRNLILGIRPKIITPQLQPEIRDFLHQKLD